MDNKTKIYLDWNVMAELRNPISEPWVSIAKKLEQHSDKVELPYSPAHVSDLIKGWDESEAKDKFTRDDLKHISKVTKNLFYVLYHEATEVKSLLKDPEVHFDDVKDDETKTIPELIDFEKMAAEETDPELKTAFTTLVNTFKGISFDLNIPSVSENSELAKIQGLIPKKGQSMFDTINQFAEFSEDVKKNPNTYKEW